MASSSLYKLVAASLSLIIFLALLLLRLQIHCPLSFRDPKLFPLLSLCACHLKIFSPGLPMTDTFSLFQTHSPVRVMSCFLRSTSAVGNYHICLSLLRFFPPSPTPSEGKHHVRAKTSLLHYPRHTMDTQQSLSQPNCSLQRRYYKTPKAPDVWVTALYTHMQVVSVWGSLLHLNTFGEIKAQY